MDLNVVVLAGRLAADPELRTFSSGTSLMRFLVTTRQSRPRRRVDVVPVTLWDPSSELAGSPPVRGDRLWLAGAVQRRFWSSDDASRSRIEVVAHAVEVDEPGARTSVAGERYR